MSTGDALLLLLIALPLLFVWAYVIIDILRRHDLGTGTRIVWILAALLIPLLTIAVYLLVRPRARPTSAAGPPGPTPVEPTGGAGPAEPVPPASPAA
jgi:hypothetical protein